VNTFPVSSIPAARKHPIANGVSWFASMLIFIGVMGCRDSIESKSLPAPIRDEVEYNLIGRIHRVWSADNFEFGDQQELHFILVRGVDCPKLGQAFHSQSRRAARALTNGKDVRIEVVGRDELMTEIADVFVSNEDNSTQDETNVGLELIKRGLGWYDGNEFEGADVYRLAQEEAKAQKIGLWSLENPVSPAEFEAQMNQTMLDKLKD
jgi:endonuclease YncB( thermonuclease family)